MSTIIREGEADEYVYQLNEVLDKGTYTLENTQADKHVISISSPYNFDGSTLDYQIMIPSEIAGMIKKKEGKLLDICGSLRKPDNGSVGRQAWSEISSACISASYLAVKRFNHGETVESQQTTGITIDLTDRHVKEQILNLCTCLTGLGDTRVCNTLARLDVDGNNKYRDTTLRLLSQLMECVETGCEATSESEDEDE